MGVSVERTSTRSKLKPDRFFNISIELVLNTNVVLCHVLLEKMY